MSQAISKPINRENSEKSGGARKYGTAIERHFSSQAS